MEYTEKSGEIICWTVDKDTGESKEFNMNDIRTEYANSMGDNAKYANIVVTGQEGQVLGKIPPDDDYKSDQASTVKTTLESEETIDIENTVFCLTNDGKYLLKTGKKDATYGIEEFKVLEEAAFIEEIKKILKKQGYTKDVVTIKLDFSTADRTYDKTINLKSN